MKKHTLSALGVTRIALLSDTHGDIAAGLEAALQNAELIVHAGDIGSATVLARLADIAPCVAVIGNNDVPAKWPRGQRSALTRLPECAELSLTGGILGVVHGHQWPRVACRHARLRQAWPDARCVVYGHSHRAVIDDAALPWILNPGAAGRQRALGGAGWLGLNVSARRWTVHLNGFR